MHHKHVFQDKATTQGVMEASKVKALAPARPDNNHTTCLEEHPHHQFVTLSGVLQDVAETKKIHKSKPA